MGKFSVKQVFLLLCLSSLTAAIPNPLTLQETTLLNNSFSNILPDSTLGAPVIPNDFTVRPSLPLDEPVLNRRNSLLLTLRALGDLAILDFTAEQRSQTWQAVQLVSIDIVGPAKTIGSPLAVRKYALWGIYKAIQLMVVSQDFRPRNFDLIFQGTLVGYVGFNNGVQGGLGMENGSANETDAAVQRVDLSISSLDNATTTNAESNEVHIDFELKGLTIGEDNVFMTVFTGILKAAPYYPTETFDSFLLNARTFNSLLSCKAREDLGPGESHLGYMDLIQVFTQLPRWVILQGRERWTEAEFLIWATVGQRFQVIGAGLMKWQARLTTA